MAACAVAVPSAARAQSTGSLLVAPVLPPGFTTVENQGVLDRARPGWQALGIRLGSFRLRPTASVAGGGTSNAYLTRSDARDSAFITSGATFDLTSGWSRHYLSLRGSGQANTFVGNSALDTTSWSLAASGRYDIHSTLQVAATGDLTRDNESRFAGEAISANFAVSPFIRESAVVRANYNPGRIGLLLTANYRHFHFLPVTFQDGTRADQSVRDRTLTEVVAQATFARTPSFGLFGQVSASRTRFDSPAPSLLVLGNSEGLRALAGVNLQIQGLATGSIGVGWSRRNYAEQRLGTRSGLSVEAAVELLPEDRTTITLNARRQLSDANPTTGPSWETFVSATVDHEVRRNIIASTTVGYTRQRFLDQAASGNTAFFGGVSGTYLISRKLEARTNLIYRASDARNLGTLTETRGSIGLTLKI
jgi:hypothetical protein